MVMRAFNVGHAVLHGTIAVAASAIGDPELLGQPRIERGFRDFTVGMRFPAAAEKGQRLMMKLERR